MYAAFRTRDSPLPITTSYYYGVVLDHRCAQPYTYWNIGMVVKPD